MTLPFDVLGRLFRSDGFLPRRFCGLWPDWLVWEHVAGNALIWLAYVALPILIWRLGRQRPELGPFGLVGAFSGFIVLCGLGHFLDMLAFFMPLYYLSGQVLIAAGLASWWTAWSLRRAWPALMAMRGPAQLEAEVAARTRELDAALSQFRVLLECLPEIVWTSRPDGTLDSFNRRWYEFTGLPEGCEGDERWVPILHPDDLPGCRADWLEAVRSGHPYEREFRLEDRHGGGYRWFLGRSAPLRDEAGRIVKWFGTCTDIDVQKRAEEVLRRNEHELEERVRARTAELEAVNAAQQRDHEALRLSEERFRGAFDAAAFGMALVNPDGGWEMVNDSLCRIFGYSEAELLAMTFQEITHPHDLDTDLGLVRRLVAGEIPSYQLEKRYFHKDGHVVWASLSVTLVRDSGGRPLHFVAQIGDVTRRREAEEARRLSERNRARMSSILESTSDLVGIADLGGRILYTNRAGRDLLGFGPEEDMEGQRIGDFHPAWAFEKLATEAIPAAIRDGVWRGESAILARDGRVVPTSQVIIAKHSDRGEGIDYIATIARDITGQRRAEEELRVARDHALAATRAKSDFLANMSHEVRTPMNGIVGVGELLLDTPLDEQQRDLVETIQASADALLTLINDILDLSKIEAGKLDLDVLPFDLRGLLDDVARLLTPRARQKGLRITRSVAPDVPSRLVGDPARIRQVVTNLAANAVRFTDAGEVGLDVRLLAASEAGATLRLEVRDTGVGIPEDQRSRLFESFSQVEGSPEHRRGGTGLGLAICRSLVGLMRGRIGLESDPGRGSTFWVELTLGMSGDVDALPADLSPADGPVDRPIDRSYRVLLADDHEVNRKVAVQMIRRLGCRVDAVADGREAVAALEESTYDVVLMDVQMPGLDGLGATAEVRRRESGTGRRVPIIALTANAMTGDREHCLAAGMDDYLSKPLKTRPLREALLRWGPSPAEVVAATATTIATTPAIQIADGPSFDPELLEECSGGNASLIAEILHSFLDTAPANLHSIEAAAGAADALELDREVHHLKGACHTIGARPMAAACEALLAQTRRGDLADARTTVGLLVNRWERVRDDLDTYLGGPGSD